MMTFWHVDVGQLLIATGLIAVACALLVMVGAIEANGRRWR